MEAVHKTLLEVNEEFLVSEAPATPLLHALQDKHVLTDLDLQQLRSLEPQGSRAVKRFVLHVLPQRGPLAFPAFLESLQEARAQHLVDLLLEEEAVLNAAVKPIELPERREPPKLAEDPNEYARRLRANSELIEDAVDPQHVIPVLLQNGVLSELEERLLAEVKGQHALTWSVLWGVLMQRGASAYSAFMGALLRHGYDALFHTIQETKVTGREALTPTLTRNSATTVSSKDKRRQVEADDHDARLNLSSPPGYNSPSVRRGGGYRDADAALGFSPAFAISPRDGGPLATSSPSPQVSALKPVFSRRGWRGGGGAGGGGTGAVGGAGGGGGGVVRSGGPVSSSMPSRLAHAGPLYPGYSLGDLDFMYTPRSERLVHGSGTGAARQEGSGRRFRRPVDSLYSPTWAEPYDHLRTSDVGSSRLMMHRMSYSPGAVGADSDLGLDRPLDSGFPSKHASVDPATRDAENGNGVDDGRNTNPAFEREPGKENGAAGLGTMNTIPEQDSDSDQTDVEKSTTPSRKETDQQAGDDGKPRTTESPRNDLQGSHRIRPSASSRHSYRQEPSRDPNTPKTETASQQRNSGTTGGADAPREATTPKSRTSAGKQQQGSAKTPRSPVNNHIDSKPAADKLPDSTERNNKDHPSGDNKEKPDRRIQQAETDHDSQTAGSDKYGVYRSNSY